MKDASRLFNGIPDEARQKLAAYFKHACFSKREHIRFGASETSDYIYMVRVGRVKISYLSPEGKEITVTILHPGDVYSMHSEATAIALEPTEILYVDTESFKNIVLNDQRLAANLIRILGTILKNTNDALLNLAFKEVNSRLATLLLKMAREEGAPTLSGLSFELKLTHEEIANLISCTRQTVTTILNRFEKTGIITLRKKCLTINNLEELEALSS